MDLGTDSPMFCYMNSIRAPTSAQRGTELLGVGAIARRECHFIRSADDALRDNRLDTMVTLLAIHDTRDESGIDISLLGNSLDATMPKAVFAVVSREVYFAPAGHLLTLVRRTKVSL